MIIRLLRSRVGADGGCWLTGGNSGDPSRTLIKNSAKVFTNKESAEKYIKKIIKDNPQRNYGRTDFLIENPELMELVASDD